MPDFKASDLALWQDHVKNVMTTEAAIERGTAQLLKLDQESIQKTFEGDVYKISLDTATFVQHMEQLSKNDRAKQIARVCHMRAEHKRGSGHVVDFMATACHHEVALYKDVDALESVKKALRD